MKVFHLRGCSVMLKVLRACITSAAWSVIFMAGGGFVEGDTLRDQTPGFICPVGSNFPARPDVSRGTWPFAAKILGTQTWTVNQSDVSALMSKH